MVLKNKSFIISTKKTTKKTTKKPTKKLTKKPTKKLPTKKLPTKKSTKKLPTKKPAKKSTKIKIKQRKVGSGKLSDLFFLNNKEKKNKIIEENFEIYNIINDYNISLNNIMDDLINKIRIIENYDNSVIIRLFKKTGSSINYENLNTLGIIKIANHFHTTTEIPNIKIVGESLITHFSELYRNFLRIRKDLKKKQKSLLNLSNGSKNIKLIRYKIESDILMLYLFIKLFLAKFYFTDYHRDNKAIASSYTINKQAIELYSKFYNYIDNAIAYSLDDILSPSKHKIRQNNLIKYSYDNNTPFDMKAYFTSIYHLAMYADDLEVRKNWRIKKMNSPILIPYSETKVSNSKIN